MQLEDTRAKSSDGFRGQNTLSPGHSTNEQSRPIDGGTSFEELTHRNTIIIFDSAHKADAKDPLIDGKDAWLQLTDTYRLSPKKPLTSADLAFYALQLTLEAVASKWSTYVFHMHNHIASLEEQIYSQPADDRRSSGLWSVLRQLLQAERLLKFHILLLKNVQNDFVRLAEPDACAPDWLQQCLDEYTKLSSEVEETLKKPITHMVDLVSLSIYFSQMLLSLLGSHLGLRSPDVQVH